MSDDDGLITNMYNRQDGSPVDATSVGQTFLARGVNLISAAFWLADPTFPVYVVRVFQNGPGGSDGHIYQRVSGVTPGLEYTFRAWVMTAPRENSTWKYDVWDRDTRIIYMRLGIDPTGGTNALASTVQWTPRMYSHRRYCDLAKSAVAQSSNLTAFVSMKGDQVEWHNYAVDNCLLSAENILTRFLQPTLAADGTFQATILV